MEKIKTSEVILKGARAAAALGLCATALTACAGETPELKPDHPGVVVDTDHTFSSTSVIWAGKVPIIITTPEKWSLDVKQCDRPSDTYADVEGCVTVWTTVDQSTFESHPVGSEYSFTIEQ